MKAVNPYLTFEGNTEEAFEFYKAVFGGELHIVRFKDLGEDDMGARGDERNKIANVALPLDEDTVLMGSDVLESMGHSLTVGDNFSILLEVESAEEGERLFNALSDGGQVTMPLEETEWAEAYGICIDPFGIQWMVNYTGEREM